MMDEDSMAEVTNEALIEKASAVVHSRKVGAYLVGDVGAALLTEAGNIYTGVCIDVSSGIGFCAEHSAIAAMVTAGESRIKKIVAVWKDEAGRSYVLAPCGRCREFMRQIDPANLSAEVILEGDKALPLADLLPYHGWFFQLPSA
jgi:cytidine deaminase